MSDFEIAAHSTGKDTIHIDWFAVPVRRKGKGRAAYEEFEASLPKRIKYLTLHAADSGGGATDGFWEAMGFDYVYWGSEDLSEEDKHFMIKAIHGATTPKPIRQDDEDET